MATKKILSIKMKCVSVNHNEGRSTATLAEDVRQTDKGPIAKNALSISLGNDEQLSKLKPGQSYMIEITE